jgi:hypothetical protein
MYESCLVGKPGKYTAEENQLIKVEWSGFKHALNVLYRTKKCHKRGGFEAHSCLIQGYLYSGSEAERNPILTGGR